MLKAVINSPIRSGDQTINNGNLVFGTALKGVNFTANTPLAGATSQLMNWYETGSWTPTVTAQTGTITTVGATSCTYTRVGKLVTVTVNVVITTNGTGATSVNVTLPFSASAHYYYGIGQEIAQTGKRLYSTITSGTNNYMAIVNVDGTYPGLDGSQLTISMTYQVA